MVHLHELKLYLAQTVTNNKRRESGKLQDGKSIQNNFFKQSQ